MRRPRATGATLPASLLDDSVPSRAARAEAVLGDPAAPGNPAGYQALLAADRSAVPPAEAEAVLDDFGLDAEFVPRELGGRFDSAEGLLRVLRPVFRRDTALGLGYGLTTFTAASAVWLSGSTEQRSDLARRILSGSKAAVATYETAHTNDHVHGRISAVPGPGDTLTVTGLKPVVINLGRADALVLFCRTSAPHGGGSHCALLLDPCRLSDTRYRAIVRSVPEGSGLRAYVGSGVWLDDCPVSRDALLGQPGTGMATALRTAHVSRVLTAAFMVAALDTALRTAVQAYCAEKPGAARKAPNDSGSAARALIGALVDLLLYDSLAVTTARALQLRPAEAGVHAAAVTSLTPTIFTDTMYGLATVLGARTHADEGAVGAFRKHLRDVPLMTLGHAGTAAARSTLIPQLRRLARASWGGWQEAPCGLFRPGAALPPFPYGELPLAGGADSLSGTITVTAAAPHGRDPVERNLRALAEHMANELRDLRTRVLALPLPTPGSEASPAWCALADRYAWVLAAAAVLGVWRHQRTGFLADPAWATLALHRIARRLGLRPMDPPPECAPRIHQEVLARFTEPRGYDLYATPLAG
ncbi:MULTISPECIES: acyl-CoA dehydrogenase [Streptomyces]|uniref:acyl-CoA dehydrogenase n=1 Tax=Streptomyces lycopersici TaxID=2974589 RepID=UPI0021CE4B24|nr:acyl-CoA dehydrogenase [Streptomyces sp. NEAU-383]